MILVDVVLQNEQIIQQAHPDPESVNDLVSDFFINGVVRKVREGQHIYYSPREIKRVVITEAPDE